MNSHSDAHEHDGDDDEDFFRRDPLEKDPVVGPLIAQAAAEATSELAAMGISMRVGYCHLHWATMRRILAEKHGVHWRSPAELNSDIRFD